MRTKHHPDKVSADRELLGMVDPGTSRWGEHGEFVVEMPLDPDSDRLWWIAGTYLHTDDGWVLAEIRIFPGGSHRSGGADQVAGEWTPSPDVAEHITAGGISAQLLRAVSLSDLDAYRSESVSAWSSNLPNVESLAEMADVGLRPGRKGRDDGFYANWARRYVDAYQRDPKRVNQLLAQENGMTADQVRDLNSRTRRRGMLTKPSGRKAGGELTPHALALLADEAR